MTRRHQMSEWINRQWLWCFLGLALFALAWPAGAATIVGVVSERSAAELAAGAEQFAETYPDYHVILRAPEQVARLDKAELAGLINKADAVLMAAVFGEQVGRLVRALATEAGERLFPILAINGDRSLTRLSRLDGQSLLSDLDDQQLNQLMAAPDPGADVATHNERLKNRFSGQALWLEGHILYQARTPDHLDALLRWLLVQAGHELEVPELPSRSLIRYYRDGEATDDPADPGLQSGPVVALLDLDSGDRPGDRAVLDDTCQALEARGLQCFAVLGRWGGASLEAVRALPVGPGKAVPARRNVVFTTSGLFRDLYGSQLVWLDQAVLMALDASAETIRNAHPQLTPALDQALSALPPEMRRPGTESLDLNGVARRWVADTQALIADGMPSGEAGTTASYRVFGAAPGAYGAGVNRLASRSGAWTDRHQLGDAYRRRMGHVYGLNRSGKASQQAFDRQLQTVGHTYLGRASHLYGLLDNDDGFDFQGGLSNAVEHLRGEPPQNRVLQYADPANPQVSSLQRALDVELRARNLNPQWLAPLMEHGYAGARTMGSDFLDNLWGWQVTSPQVVRSGVWGDVNDVYFQDHHDLGLDEFLSQGHNVHVKTHMQAITLLAAKRGFWDADPFVLDQLARDFANGIVDHGLPGDGHTRPGHPLMDWVADRLDPAQREAFNAARKGGPPPENSQDNHSSCQSAGSLFAAC